MRFDGRVAIVTGASRGIGRAHAVLLASRGAAVVAGGRDASTDEVAAEIQSAGGRAVAHRADVTAATAGQDLVDAAVEAFGGVDIVISNAGGLARSGIGDTTAEDVAAQLELDVLAAFTLVKAAWPHLEARRYGRIVLTTSTGAFGSPTALPYSVAKSGLIGLTRTLAAAGTAAGIVVNAVAPFGYSRLAEQNPNLSRAEVSARAQLAPPELVAAGVAALAHESCPVSGELFAIGAGRMTRILLAATPGITDPGLTPERVAASWDAIMDAGVLEPVGLDYANVFYAAVPGWADATG